MHLDAQLSTWMTTESESNRVPVAVPAVANKQTVAAVLYHAEVWMLRLLKPFPLDAPFLTLLCLPFLCRRLMADDAIASPTDLTNAEAALPTDSWILNTKEALCFLLHLVAARLMVVDAFHVRDSLHIRHNNQPWMTSTPQSDHGATTVNGVAIRSESSKRIWMV